MLVSRSWWLAILIVLSGCTAQGVYENAQKNGRDACIKEPPGLYDECIKRFEKSYDEYEQERKEALEESKETP
ncbi:MAG: hypothetical protein HWE13_14725 [Gammaproteobacteria bacterium]|nr:hypothetical protein [Gammaproteobacteria bacterium]